MVEILLLIIIILLIINIYITLKLKGIDTTSLSKDLDNKLIDVKKTLRDEFCANREESRKNEQNNRQELSASIDRLNKTMISSLVDMSTLQKNQLDTYSTTIERNMDTLNYNLRKSIDDMSNAQKEKLADLSKTTEDNLEKMRLTVDEKLQSTLEKRLGESFKLVSERLEQVQKGLGEMQNLASGVGDLKKVLSNVKTRGVLGEIQLDRILEQILSPQQYEKNVVTKKGSRETVEFAIKLPGRDEGKETIYLPLDAKFPLDIYNKLIDAYESNNQNLISSSSKELDRFIKKSAKDIRDKYIDPPNTTDFAILFLPTEGLYAEVVKRQELVELLQREYKINITGPTTLVALLNSLQMGFRTLAIEKHSSEVWKVLGAVKTEFTKFESVLNSAQNKLNQASTEIDKLVGTRTRQINKKLKDVEMITKDEINTYIDFSNKEDEN